MESKIEWIKSIHRIPKESGLFLAYGSIDQVEFPSNTIFDGRLLMRTDPIVFIAEYDATDIPEWCKNRSKWISSIMFCEEYSWRVDTPIYWAHLPKFPLGEE